MSRRWPTPAEVDADRNRWWWVQGEPCRLSIDRMEHPHRVKWFGRYIIDLPVDLFGGPVMTPEEADSLRLALDVALARAREVTP